METTAAPSSAPPRLRRTLTLWDLIFYGIVLIQHIAPVPLYGVAQKLSDGHFVTIILIAFFSATTWNAFRAQEINNLRFSGAVIMILALAVMAHQALTNDDYRTSKATLIGQRFMFFGVILFVIGGLIWRR